MLSRLTVLAVVVLVVAGEYGEYTVVAMRRSSPFMLTNSVAQGRNSISGIVWDSSRRPLDNVRVELLDEVDGLIASTRTRGSGRYVFQGLSTGVFQVRVLPYGTDYENKTERVTLGNVLGRGAQSEQVDFSLRLKSENARPSAPPGTVFAQKIPDEARKVYEIAVKDLAQEGTVEKGLAGLQKAVEIFPRYYMALELLGTERAKRGQYAEAVSLLTTAIEVNPRGQMCFYALGIAQYNLKQRAAALESLQRAVALAPNSVNSQFWLGIVLFREGKIAEAEAPLTRARSLGSKNIPDVHMYLAQVYSNTKRYGEAADELDAYLREVPNARDAETLRALVKRLRDKAQTKSR